MEVQLDSAFLGEEDLDAAIGQMTQAIEILEAIGADQSLQSAADHQKYMAGRQSSLVRLRSSMKQVLLSSEAFECSLRTVGCDFKKYFHRESANRALVIVL